MISKRKRRIISWAPEFRPCVKTEEEKKFEWKFSHSSWSSVGKSIVLRKYKSQNTRAKGAEAWIELN